MMVKLEVAYSSGFSVILPSSHKMPIVWVVREQMSRSLEQSKINRLTSSEAFEIERSALSAVPIANS